VPVPLRLGGRAFGGAMTWEQPLGLAPFEADSAFAGLEVAGPAELDALCARLQAAGIAFAQDDALAAVRGVTGLVRCSDPDGLAIELHYGPSERTEQPFASPAAVSGGMGQAPSAPSAPVPLRPGESMAAKALTRTMGRQQ
jgi:hypothetical protein